MAAKHVWAFWFSSDGESVQSVEDCVCFLCNSLFDIHVSNQMQQERETAELCRNDCGFFGAPGSGGMCSVCWKKTMSDRQAAATTTSTTTTVTSLCLDETKATDVTSFESMTSSMKTTENTITSLEKTTEKRAESFFRQQLKFLINVN